MKSVKITIREDVARQLYPSASPELQQELRERFGNKVLRLDPKDWIQKFDDVLDFHGIDPLAFSMGCTGQSKDEVAYKQLKLIVAAYNDNKQPDWDDSNQGKYHPWFDLRSASAGGPAVGLSFFVGNRARGASCICSYLVFLNEDHAWDAVKKFLPVYKAYFAN